MIHDGIGHARGVVVAFWLTEIIWVDAEQVRRFHAEALKAGGIDNGKPGPRPHYHPGYYAAFVLDPACGVNFEVVCRESGAEEGAGSSE